MKKSIFYLLHALVFGVFVALIISSATEFSSYYKKPILFMLFDSTMCLGSYLGLIYFSYWLFIPQFLIKKQYFKFVLGLVTIVGGFSLYFNFYKLVSFPNI